MTTFREWSAQHFFYSFDYSRNPNGKLSGIYCQHCGYVAKTTKAIKLHLGRCHLALIPDWNEYGFPFEFGLEKRLNDFEVKQ